MYLSANRFPAKWENKIRTSNVVFRLPASSEKGLWMKTKFELLYKFSFVPWLHATELQLTSNACSLVMLVPTVFLRHWKTEFELPFLFSVYPRHRKREFKIRFWFYFLTTLKMEFELLFPFFVFRFRKKLKNEIWSFFRFSFLRFCHFRILPEPEEWSSSCSSCR